MKASDLELLLPDPAPEPLLVPRWGTVTQNGPLRIRLDGDTAALPVDPSSLVSGLEVGDRVFCLLAGRQLVVAGANGFGGDPAGVVKEFAGSVAPEGWLLCQGQAVSRTTYARLFAVIGQIYGGGDGSTTFNLPDRRGRVAVGVDTGQTEFNALGKTGGAKGETLTEAQIPPHEHTNTMIGIKPGSGTGWYGGFRMDSFWQMVQIGGTFESYGSGTYHSGAKGGGQPHNNLQPYIVMNYIIKT